MFPSYKGPGFVSPVDYMRLGGEVLLLAMEAQSVIAMRVLGMSGLWAVRPSENERMVSEKTKAFALSANAAARAAVSGKNPDKVMSAALKPLKRRTSSNVKRLTKIGPKFPMS